jgi:hypothetical protein
VPGLQCCDEEIPPRLWFLGGNVRKVEKSDFFGYRKLGGSIPLISQCDRFVPWFDTADIDHYRKVGQKTGEDAGAWRGPLRAGSRES